MFGVRIKEVGGETQATPGPYETPLKRSGLSVPTRKGGRSILGIEVLRGKKRNFRQDLVSGRGVDPMMSDILQLLAEPFDTDKTNTGPSHRVRWVGLRVSKNERLSVESS